MHLISLLLLTILTIATPIFAADRAITTAKEDVPVLTKEAAIKALQVIQGEVLSVSPTDIPGFYLVAMRMQGKIVPIFLDHSGAYLFSGNLIRLKDKANLTESYFQQLNPIDISTIPLDEGMTLGNPEATQQIIVFTDPHCPYCTQLHQVLHEAVAANPDLAFHIKLIPFKASSKKIAETILCNKSMEQLEMAFSGQPLPETTCETDAITKNLNLAQKLGIRGTPTMLLPNGQIAGGTMPLNDLLQLIEKNRAATK